LIDFEISLYHGFSILICIIDGLEIRCTVLVQLLLMQKSFGIGLSVLINNFISTLVRLEEPVQLFDRV